MHFCISISTLGALIVSLVNARSPSSSGKAVGDLIAQGIGVTAGSSTSLGSVSQTPPFRNSTSTNPGIISPTLPLRNSTTVPTATSGLGGSNYNCTNKACGVACSNSWVSWSSASTKWVDAFATTSTSTISYYDATWAEVPIATTAANGSMYANCDGIPRFSGGVDYWTTTNSSVGPTSSTWYVINTATTSTFPAPTPSCIISGSRCEEMVGEWHASHYLAVPYNLSTGFSDYWPVEPPTDLPHCNTTGATGLDFVEWLYEDNRTIVADGSGCWIKGASARLFYWPETIQENNQSCPDGTYTAPAQTATNASTLVTKVVTLSETYYNCCTTTVTMTSPTMYLSIQDMEARDASWGFYGAPVAATVIPVAPGDLVSQVIAPPLITNAALSSSAMSVIANQETEKYTDLFGYNWQQYLSVGLGGPNLPFQTVKVNPADLGRPPQPLSYYFGAVGWYCLNANAFAVKEQPISVGLPGGLPCDTIFDDYYYPWIQIPSTVNSGSTCNLMFGWDPPIALTQGSTIDSITVLGQASATATATQDAGNTTPAAPGSVSSATTTPTAAPDSESAILTSLSQSQNQPAQSTPAQSGGQLSETSTSTIDPQTPGSVSTAVGDPTTSPDQQSTQSPDQQSTQSPSQPSTQPLNDPSALASAVIATVGSGSSAVTIVSDPSSSGQVIASSAGGASTLTAGGQGTIGMQAVSVDSTGSVIVSSATTIVLASDPSSSIGDGGSTTGSSDPQVTAVVDGGTTLTAGGPGATISGATISVLSFGGVVVLSDGSSSVATLQSNGQISIGSGRTLSAVVITASAASGSGVQIGSQTLSAGGVALTSNGVTYSALSSGGIVVQSGGTSQTVTAGSNGILSLDNSAVASEVAILPTTAPGVVLDGQTLTAGGAAVVTNGVTYSALPSGFGVEVISQGGTRSYDLQGSSVVSLGNGQVATFVPLGSSSTFVTTLAGQTISAISHGVVIDGTTITEGGSAETIHNTAYSVNSNGQLVAMGSSTLGNGDLSGLIGAIETAATASGRASASGPVVALTTTRPGSGTVPAAAEPSATHSTTSAASATRNGPHGAFGTGLGLLVFLLAFAL